LSSGNTSIVPAANGNIAITVAGTSNVLVVSNVGTAVTGNTTVTGNISASSAIITNQINIGTGAISVSNNVAGIFNASVTDITMGVAANVALGSSSGNTTINGNLVANNNVTVNGNVSANLLTGTLTTAAQPNITSVGILTSLTVSGNVSIGNTTSNTVQANSIVSARTGIAVTTSTVIDSFDMTDYRSAKYVLRSSSDLGYESLEVLLIHNDINSYVTVYGAVNTGNANTVAIATGINSGNVELRATGLGSNTVVNLIGTYIPD
jgi:hypothetical protein